MTKTSPKKKSFIRYEAIGGIIVLSIIIALIALFLLEPILKYSIEMTGYKSIGSEVNLDRVKIDWSKPSLTLYNLQITDHEKPSQNIVQISKIEANFSWESLLRLSATSEISNVKDIQMHSERSSPGRVMPKEKRLVQINSSTTNKAVENLKEEANNDVLSQALSMAQGDTSEKEALKALEEQLKTKQVSKELESRIDGLKKDWKNFKNKGLEGEKTKLIVKEMENFKFESGNTEEFKKSIKSAKALLKKAKTHYKSLKTEVNDLKSQSKTLQNKIKTSPEAFINDLKYAKGTLGDGILNPGNLTSSMLSSYIAVQLQQLSTLRDSIQKQLLKDINSYSPVDVEDLTSSGSNTNNKKKEVSVGSLESKKADLANEKGRWVHFDKATPRPKLWMKVININSKSKESQDLGDFTGVVKNLTTEPQVIGIPLTANIDGEIRKLNMKGLNINAVMDYTKPSDPKEDVSLNISSFPVSGLELVDSSKYLISIAKALGNSGIDLSLRGDQVNLSLDQNFLSPIWDMSLKKDSSKKLEALLNEIKKEKEKLSVRADVTGTISNPNISIASNLGTIIKNAIERQISTKIQDTLSKEQEKINKLLREKLGPYAEDIDLLSLSLDKDSKSLDGITDQFENKIKDAAKEKGKEKLDKLKDKLFKKIKF